MRQLGPEKHAACLHVCECITAGEAQAACGLPGPELDAQLHFPEGSQSSCKGWIDIHIFLCSGQLHKQGGLGFLKKNALVLIEGFLCKLCSQRICACGRLVTGLKLWMQDSKPCSGLQQVGPLCRNVPALEIRCLMPALGRSKPGFNMQSW